MVQQYKSFVESNAYEKLAELAKTPYDLTAPGALTRDGRLEKYVCRGPLINLHYSTERIDDRVLELFQELADDLELVEQFKSMRRGAVLNRIHGVECENRQVLHTSSRDVFKNVVEPESSIAAQKELDKLKTFLSALESGEVSNSQGKPFEALIHVGIGGSDLGPRSIYEALAAYGKKGRRVHFISNVDPDDAAATLAKVDLSTALVAIVSKSGTTLETLTNEKIVCEALVRKGLKPEDHCVAVTGQGSPMDDPAKYLRSFYMFDYIGGRYSSTSMVGAVTLGFYLGFEQLMEFLAGASIIDNHAETAAVTENVPLLLALIGVWNHNFLHYPTVAVLPYCQGLHRFPAHLQQCDMESNGKSVMRSGLPVQKQTGPLVWGEPGTNGQHAFYQLLHQGTEIVPVEFIGFQHSQYGEDLVVEGSTSQEKLLANLYAQIVAMAIGQKSDNPNKIFSGNRPSALIFAKKLTPESMGALLALYEAKIVFQGFVWNINSFDQEGVQLGKVLAGRFLRAMGRGKNMADSLEKKFIDQVQSRE